MAMALPTTNEGRASGSSTHDDLYGGGAHGLGRFNDARVHLFDGRFHHPSDKGSSAYDQGDDGGRGA